MLSSHCSESYSPAPKKQYRETSRTCLCSIITQLVCVSDVEVWYSCNSTQTHHGAARTYSRILYRSCVWPSRNMMYCGNLNSYSKTTR